MAKYVLIAFEDDANADTFVQATQANGLVVGEGPNVFTHLTPEVRAVYKMPTQFCECVPDKKTRGFSRGKKWGWWVHSGCGRPTRAWARGEHWFQALGRNLLPKTPQAPEYRGDGEFGVPREQAR